LHNTLQGVKDFIKTTFPITTPFFANIIKEILAKICSDTLMRRIEVVNLDRRVSGFFKRNVYTHDIDYGKSECSKYRQ